MRTKIPAHIRKLLEELASKKMLMVRESSLSAGCKSNHLIWFDLWMQQGVGKCFLLETPFPLINIWSKYNGYRQEHRTNQCKPQPRKLQSSDTEKLFLKYNLHFWRSIFSFGRSNTLWCNNSTVVKFTIFTLVQYNLFILLLENWIHWCWVGQIFHSHETTSLKLKTTICSRTIITPNQGGGRWISLLASKLSCCQQPILLTLCLDSSKTNSVNSASKNSQENEHQHKCTSAYRQISGHRTQSIAGRYRSKSNPKL